MNKQQLITKPYLVTLLQDEYTRWQTLVSALNADQLTTPLAPSDLSIQDTLAHLMAWQKRSIARLEAGQTNHPPLFPPMAPGLEPDIDDSTAEATNRINAAIYRTYHNLPFAEVHKLWSDGYQKLISLAQQTPESDLLDKQKYPWLDGYSLGDILNFSYEHHHDEHLTDSALLWLRQNGQTALADQIANLPSTAP